MARSRERTRRGILDAAYVLFRRKGFTRVNVDEISAAAGITKRTLYTHFPSKDALLEEVLKSQHELAFAAFKTFSGDLAGAPHRIIDVLFSELARWSKKPRWAGSGFTRLAMELADLPGHPARRIARIHKTLIESHIAQVLNNAGLPDPQGKARQVCILTEGAMALMLINGDRDYCTAAQEAAQVLIAPRVKG
jgi:AcrR family transcriptional regulator